MNRAAPKETAESFTVDRFLDGRVTLVQPRAGHRAGLDAALLQALVPGEASGQAVDLGAGVGVIAFCLAARAPALTVTAVERDRQLLKLAEVALAKPENAAFAERVRLVEADVTEAGRTREAAMLGEASADWLLMNPPFDQPDRVRQSPDPGRRSAHIGEAGLLAAWCGTAAVLLKRGGTLGVIHRTAALPDILEALTGRFGDVRIRPVHPFATSPARRILLRARRGSRGPLRILPGLVLHRPDGGWTAEAEAILRGRADAAS